MKHYLFALIGLGLLAVGGCGSGSNALDPPKPMDQMSHAELCAYYPVYISRKDISDESRKTAIAKLNTMGCGTGQ